MRVAAIGGAAEPADIFVEDLAIVDIGATDEFGDEQRGWLFIDFFRRTELRQPAAMISTRF